VFCAWFSFVRKLLVSATVSACLGAPVGALASESAWSETAIRSVTLPEGIRVLSGGHGAASGVVKLLERSGYHVEVAVLPGTFFVRPGTAAGPIPDGFVDVTPQTPPPSERTGPPSAPAALIKAANASMFENPLEGRADVLLPSASDGWPPSGTAASAPALSPPLPNGLFYGTRWKDTSELMIGTIAVPILFPESDGSADPNKYDWTPALRDSVIRSAIRGLLLWTSHASAHGVPLTFLVEVHPVLPTRYEPIDRPVSDASGWIEDVLEPLVGYRGDAVSMAYQLANAARARLGAHWAAVLFAVQNVGDPTPGFSDGIGEYARLGGPYFVILAQPSNYGAGGTIDFYVEHEMTHMFWALDEYPSNNAWWSCTLRTGYFNQLNTNSDIPLPAYCGPTQHCFMKGNYPYDLCPPTARQIGWVDLDGSGTLDLYETRPMVRPDSASYGSGPGVPITIHGKAADVAIANQNPYWYGAGDSITVAVLDSLWYRLDGGAWTPIAADDGRIDQGAERFTMVLGPQGVGNHMIEFQALNSSGRMIAAPESTVLVVSGTNSPPGGGSSPAVLALRVGPSPGPGPFHFALEAGAGAEGTARLFDVAGRQVSTWPIHMSAQGIAQWEWNGARIGGGPEATGIYFLVVTMGREHLTRRFVLLR
jgi:hypothetical protein